MVPLLLSLPPNPSPPDGREGGGDLDRLDLVPLPSLALTANPSPLSLPSSYSKSKYSHSEKQKGPTGLSLSTKQKSSGLPRHCRSRSTRKRDEELSCKLGDEDGARASGEINASSDRKMTCSFPHLVENAVEKDCPDGRHSLLFPRLLQQPTALSAWMAQPSPACMAGGFFKGRSSLCRAPLQAPTPLGRAWRSLRRGGAPAARGLLT